VRPLAERARTYPWDTSARTKARSVLHTAVGVPLVGLGRTSSETLLLPAPACGFTLPALPPGPSAGVKRPRKARIRRSGAGFQGAGMAKSPPAAGADRVVLRVPRGQERGGASRGPPVFTYRSTLSAGSDKTGDADGYSSPLRSVCVNSSPWWKSPCMALRREASSSGEKSDPNPRVSR
jgi:hypothetical protein